MKENKNIEQEQNENVNKLKKTDNKKKSVLITILKVILGFILVIVLLNIMLPTSMAMIYNGIENIIKNITGATIDINGDGIGTSSDKPVIYVYGADDNQRVTVRLYTNDEIVCEYPKRNNNDSWIVNANKNGNIIIDDQEYNYLFWESIYSDADWDFSRGFCIKGSESAEFLEKALKELGLTSREANEFIVYWLPKLEKNEYNLISFQNELYKERYKLEFEPYTDNILRVFMTFKEVDRIVDIEKQDLKEIKGAFKREGLHIVEWGGSEVK